MTTNPKFLTVGYAAKFMILARLGSFRKGLIGVSGGCRTPLNHGRENTQNR